jgi:hypothetical protein
MDPAEIFGVLSIDDPESPVDVLNRCSALTA